MKGAYMQKSIIKNSHKKQIISVPQNSKVIKESSLLTTNKARESLKSIEGWQLTDDNKKIYREFILQNFMDAVDLIDRIAPIAEEEKHHPDIHLTQYRNLRIGLTTHDLGGLSEKDFYLAQKINDLLAVNKALALNQQLQKPSSSSKQRKTRSIPR